MRAERLLMKSESATHSDRNPSADVISRDYSCRIGITSSTTDLKKTKKKQTTILTPGHKV